MGTRLRAFVKRHLSRLLQPTGHFRMRNWAQALGKRLPWSALGAVAQATASLPVRRLR
jgi:hypothetical protein